MAVLSIKNSLRHALLGMDTIELSLQLWYRKDVSVPEGPQAVMLATNCCTMAAMFMWVAAVGCPLQPRVLSCRQHLQHVGIHAQRINKWPVHGGFHSS